ncbi:MAG: isoleucine--tRNA ligase [Bernardetiaceae bacterium]
MAYSESKPSSYSHIAQEIGQLWKQHDTFLRSITQREGCPTFTFFEGPPSANGLPGIHHVMARTIKDIFCRYQTLKGFQVHRKAGWDTHGLPVELQVEKELGITKEDIGTKISIEAYNQKCRQAVMRYKAIWEAITQKMGYWVDMSDPYVTYHTDYMETLWQLLQQLYNKDLLYKGYTIQPFSPKAGTGLSSHEINQPGCYRSIKDTSITAQFKIKDTVNDYFLAWTTTPWTLPSNTCLIVNKNIEYVKIETHNQYTNKPINVILAKAAIPRLFDASKYIPANEYDEEKHPKKHPYTVVETFKGEVLVGTRYEQLMPYVQPNENVENAFQVIEDDFITTEEGTGIVHAAPTFGADDKRAADRYGVPPLTVLDAQGKAAPLVDRQGRFVSEVSDFAGMYVKAEYESDATQAEPDFKPTDVKIAILLKEKNRAFKVEKYEHNYPHCWRTDKPILYYPMESWFVRTTARKDRLVALNKTIQWKPASTGEGRFGNWLENLVDWNLSRSRFWGTPLPIWRSEDQSEEICIGSLAQLKAELEAANASGLLTAEEARENSDFIQKIDAKNADLHRPYVDRITLTKSGKKLFREPDLIDVWFDSGAMPYAQWHYPFENHEKFKDNFPADFIAEGVDQTRGWFFTLHAISTLVFDSVAYKNVVSNGLVLDKSGQKMSKSKGNAIDPFEAIDRYGIDPIRWYMIANASPWDNLRFDLAGVAETARRFFATLQNTYAFFAMYANLDGYTFDPQKLVPINQLTESDRWISSRLQTLIQTVDAAYTDYEPTKAARAIQTFADQDLSNWYVRLNRKRFWLTEMNTDKAAAYQTLYQCLHTLSLLMAPIAPFYADHLYRKLHAATPDDPRSVHLDDFPKANPDLIDEDLEEQMQLAQRISSLVHSLRKKEKIRVRQPLQKILVPIIDPQLKQQIEAIKELILNEVNVKTLEYVDENADILVKRIKPNFAKLGKQYGKQMKALATQINALSQAQIRELEQDQHLELSLDGQTVSLSLDDVEITPADIPGWLVANDAQLTVALDITLTESLEQEGFARDLVNRLQNLRKEKALEVQDKITLHIRQNGHWVQAAIETHKDYICQETQTQQLTFVEELPQGETLDIEGKTITLHLQRIHA